MIIYMLRETAGRNFCRFFKHYEDKFFLVNKSFIVNIDRVERFTDKYIELKGIEEPIDLSREKRTAFKQKMLLYLAGQE